LPEPDGCACRIENRCDPGGVDRIRSLSRHGAAEFADPTDRLVDVVDSEIGCPTRGEHTGAGSEGGDSGDRDVVLDGHWVAGPIGDLPGISVGDGEVVKVPSAQFTVEGLRA
jgi:hypothetical protein